MDSSYTWATGLIRATSIPTSTSLRSTANHAIYEYTSKKRKGNKVFKTTKVKDQYGRTVYKKTNKVKGKTKVKGKKR